MAVALPALASIGASLVPKLIEKGPEIADMVSKYGPSALKLGGKIGNAIFSKSGRKGVLSFLKSRASPKGILKVITKDIPNLKNKFDQGMETMQQESQKMGMAGADEALKMAQSKAHNLYGKFIDRPTNYLQHFVPPVAS